MDTLNTNPPKNEEIMMSRTAEQILQDMTAAADDLLCNLYEADQSVNEETGEEYADVTTLQALVDEVRKVKP